MTAEAAYKTAILELEAAQKTSSATPKIPREARAAALAAVEGSGWI